jgi:dynein heavy chain
MNKVRNESVDLKIRLQSPLLLAADTTFQLANENLTLFQEMIETLIVKAKNYGSYQEKFGNTMKQVKKKVIQNEMQTDYSGAGRSILQLQAELNELEHDINLRRLLWKSIEEWDLLIKEWLKKLLDDIVVEILQKDVNRFTQNIYLLEKGLPANELVPKLKNKVMDFKKALPIIIALRNPNLKVRHYHQLRLLTYLDLTQGRGVVTMSVILETDVSFC